jgi:hypothetical protein
MAANFDRHPSETFSKLRKSGGEHVAFSKELIFDRMNFCYPKWQIRTTIFPVFPDQNLDDESNASDAVKEQMKSNRVLKLFRDISESKQLGMKIFQNIRMTKSKIKVLRDVFGVDCSSLTKLECRIEVDILAVNKSTICLTEVISDQENATNAIERLKRAEIFIKNLIKFTCRKDFNFQISKVIFTFVPMSSEISAEAAKYGITIMDMNRIIDAGAMPTILSCRSNEICPEDFVAALAFVRCCEVLRWFQSEEEKMNSSLIEAMRGLDLTSPEDQKDQMANVEEVQFEDGLFVWLDQIQAKILSDKNPFQLIMGSTARGKTMLLLMKILEVLRTESRSNVLVILLTSNLIDFYEKNFKERGIGTERITFVDAQDEFSEIVKSKNPHIFIDEYCACANVSQRFYIQMKIILPSILKKNQRLLWITADIRQGLEGSFDLANSYNAQILEEPQLVKSYLMIQHRCSKQPFKLYRDACGPLHHEVSYLDDGLPAEIIRVENEGKANLFEAWIDSVKTTLGNLKQNGWNSKDIAIIIQANDHDEVLLYPRLKAKFPDNQISFEIETLSQEWPVVIVCISEENGLSTGYLSFSRTISKLIIVIKPQTSDPKSVDSFEPPAYRKALLEILKPNRGNCCQPKPPQIEMIGLHQTVHQTQWHKFHCIQLLIQLKSDMYEKHIRLNFWMGRFMHCIDHQLNTVNFFLF